MVKFVRVVFETRTDRHTDTETRLVYSNTLHPLQGRNQLVN